MLTLGLVARLEAKQGKEEELASFLKQGLQMVKQEIDDADMVRVAFGTNNLCNFRFVP